AQAVDPSLRARVEFLTAGDGTARIEDRSTESAAENLRTVVDDLAHAGFDAVAVDLTTEDVDSVGCKVVRVVVPGLQPRDNDHTCMHLGGARLHGQLNPDPHPFPSSPSSTTRTRSSARTRARIRPSTPSTSWRSSRARTRSTA